MTYRYKHRRYIVNPDGSLEKDADGDVIGSDRWYRKQAAKKILDAKAMKDEADRRAASKEEEKKGDKP